MTSFSPLVENECAVCHAEGFLETEEGDVMACHNCSTTGHVFVCPTCGVVPTADTDVCGCSPLCENCFNFPGEHGGICAICYGATLRRIREEGDPNLKRWEDMKDRDMTPSEVADQMKEAELWGWL